MISSDNMVRFISFHPNDQPRMQTCTPT